MMVGLGLEELPVGRVAGVASAPAGFTPCVPFLCIRQCDGRASIPREFASRIFRTGVLQLRLEVSFAAERQGRH